MAQVAVRRQLEALPLCPALDGAEPLTEGRAPVVGAQPQGPGLGAHQLVEEPGAGVVEELGEELDGEGGVDLAAPQQSHGVHQGVQDHLWEGGTNGDTRDQTKLNHFRTDQTRGDTRDQPKLNQFRTDQRRYQRSDQTKPVHNRPDQRSDQTKPVQNRPDQRRYQRYQTRSGQTKSVLNRPDKRTSDQN